tara:strand:- start:323 stop:457 length:135 start_codon:yes stop_codon:yes gene_type:complete
VEIQQPLVVQVVEEIMNHQVVDQEILPLQLHLKGIMVEMEDLLF